MKKSLEEKNGIYKCSDDNMLFIIYILEIICTRTNQTSSNVLRLLKETKVYDYITEFYGVLHTEDIQCVADDMLEFMRERGAAI